MVSGVGIAMAVIGAASSVKASRDRKKAAKKATKKQEKASALESRTAEISNARERRRLVAQRRMRLAELNQAGSNSGVSGGSAISGARGSLSSNTGSALGFQNTRIAGAFGAGQLRQGAQSDLLKGDQSANQAELIGSFAGTGFKHRAQITSAFSDFGSTKPVAAGIGAGQS